MLHCQKVVWTVSIIVILLKDQFLLYMMPFDGVNPRSTLIMVNASIHHVHQVQELVDTAGCLLWFLPTYSPNMNPIEEVSRHVKQTLKNKAAVYQSCENTRLIIYSAFVEVAAADCVAYIKYAGSLTLD